LGSEPKRTFEKRKKPTLGHRFELDRAKFRLESKTFQIGNQIVEFRLRE